MGLISLVGIFTLLLSPVALERVLLPLVALAAGSLIGAALFHMIPASLESLGGSRDVWLYVLLGFVTFMAVEQALHWHGDHRGGKKPVTYLVLVGDALHNFLDGVTIAGAFLVDVRLGVTAWAAAAVHEIPQELGDFGVLVHGGWSKRQALLFNALSALTFLAGGVLTYALSFVIDVAFLIPFAAGSFLYIGAADLVPEVNKQPALRAGVVHLGCFLLGAAAMYAVALFE